MDKREIVIDASRDIVFRVPLKLEELKQNNSYPAKMLNEGYYNEAIRIFPLIHEIDLLHKVVDILKSSLYNDLMCVFGKTDDRETNEKFKTTYIEIVHRLYRPMLEREFYLHPLY